MSELPPSVRLPRPLLVVAWLLVGLGIAGFAAVRAQKAAAPAGAAAEGSFWEARNASDRPLTVTRQKDGLSLAVNDQVRLRGIDDPMRRLQSLVLQLQAGSPASVVDITLREVEGRSYGLIVAPTDPVQVVFQYREEGAAPVPLARGRLEGYAIAPGTPFEVRVDVDEDRFDVLVDGRPALSCTDGRLGEGRTSLAARRGPSTLLAISTSGTRTSQAGQPVPYADSDDLRPGASATDWGAHAASIGLGLGVVAAACLYLALLCLGRPGLGQLLNATALGLVPVALLLAVALFVKLTVRPSDALLLGVPGLALALFLLRPHVQERAARPAWWRAAGALVALALFVAAGLVVQQRHEEVLEPRLEAERLALAGAGEAPAFTLAEPLALDASNSLVLSGTYRDFDLHAKVTLQPDALLELRLRATTPPSCRGVALWLPSDARLRSGFVLEDSEVCESIGSDGEALPAGQPLELVVRVRGHEFEATAGGRRVTATELSFPTGGLVLLAARGAVEVRDLVLEPAPASGEAPAGAGWTPAVLVPALLVLLFAGLAALLLRLPFAHLVTACAFAALVFVLGLRATAAPGTLAADELLAFSGAAAALLLVPCLAQWRALRVPRAALLVLAALLAAPAAVLLAGPPLARPTWLAWNGARMEDDLAYLQHPVLRMMNGYLADHRFRGREVAVQKPPGKARVVTLGGSSTFGYGLPENSGQDYPAVLERLLNDGGTPAEVVNIACLGSTAERQFRLLRDGLAGFAPDVVTFSLFYNESFALTAADEAAEIARVCEPGFSRSLPRDLYDSWRLLQGKGQIPTLDVAWKRGTGSTLDTWRALDLDPGQPNPAQRYESLLRRLAELGRERGFCVVLIKEPTRDERLLWKDEFYAAIDTVAAEYGLTVVDPGPALRAAGGKELFIDPIHPRPRGLELIAEELAPAVRACLQH